MSKTDVLVVDDDITLCRMLRRMLSEGQYNVETSQSITDALATIERKHFDVYVIDYNLLDGSAIDIAERIRSNAATLPSPAEMNVLGNLGMSAWNMMEKIAQCWMISQARG